MQKLPASLRQELPLLAGLAVLVGLAMAGDAALTANHAGLLRGVVFVLLIALILMSAFRAIAHASEMAARLGEPRGSLLLTLSMLSIEVSLIISVMLAGKADPTMARDTMFAGLMLTLNGVVGVVLIAGGVRHRQQEFNLEGARAYLAALIPLSVIALVLPNFTRSKSGVLTDTQAVVIGIATILFYLIFLGVQTMRHREFFTDAHPAGDEHGPGDDRPGWVHFLILIAALLIIVSLGSKLAVIVDYGIHKLAIPPALGGMLIAILTLTPESVSAFRAALGDKLQHSVNVFLGGALATIGLTVPVVLIIGMLIDRRVILGLQGTDAVLLLLTLFVASLTFGGVRTNVLQGAVHLLIFLVYFVLILSP
ncbi:MAG: calcium:proton antiporter [Hyphomicrobiales bacterium]|nr:calcium:proton antiporter [Hyphomicrobiales bacterium]